ncbi:uncharacterized protein LOC129456249 [Periophthalmus magnuspinnatus]|uniref:uncharacterized protein LOC129456249 n=1 Tax=Periophthalmus magnuspinnatus TaxID=409849 RepID=UPI0024369972|nr:uncharacterized protein LOC129456249 [Periophthalmus magnuspinnatus]
MNICLLLIFSLTTGTTVESFIGCQGGWVKFFCKSSCNSSFPTNRTNMITNKANNVIVVVKNIQKEDNITVPTSNRVQPLKIGNHCSHFNHTAFIKASTTIACGKPNCSHCPDTFLCKEKGDFDCEDIRTINTHANYSKNSSGLYITITEVESQDQGLYWCVARGHAFNRTYAKVFIKVRGGESNKVLLTCCYGLPWDPEYTHPIWSPLNLPEFRWA